LVQQASLSKTRCVAAVAHSTYLRMLLAMVQDMPLLQASTLQIPNCSVNVLDFATTDKHDTLRLSGKSALFGGDLLSQASLDYSLEIPRGEVVRLNEKRHLAELVSR
jgi:broad specificity phosphatase PhoE